MKIELTEQQVDLLQGAFRQLASMEDNETPGMLLAQIVDYTDGTADMRPVLIGHEMGLKIQEVMGGEVGKVLL